MIYNHESLSRATIAITTVSSSIFSDAIIQTSNKEINKANKKSYYKKSYHCILNCQISKGSVEYGTTAVDGLSFP